MPKKPLRKIAALPAMPPQTIPAVHDKAIQWFAKHGRPLPWRQPAVRQLENPAWGVLVSEIMLQQTPVVRVLEPWKTWLDAWPTPHHLAQAPTADILRAWGRLGYPRRALRLKEAAAIICEQYGNIVPATYEILVKLPGIGDYTAAAVSTFAYGNREVVVDTNIRRTEARVFTGKALADPSPTAAEKQLANDVLPHNTNQAVQWNNAVMELGALVCTSKTPQCPECPLIQECAWVRAGQPEAEYQPTGQKWHGTDRQVRGAVMAILRASDHPVKTSSLSGQKHVGTDPVQIQRAVTGLLSDGLAVAPEEGLLALP